MLAKCWADIVDGGPTLNQHRANAPCPQDKKLYNIIRHVHIHNNQWYHILNYNKLIKVFGYIDIPSILWVVNFSLILIVQLFMVSGIQKSNDCFAKSCSMRHLYRSWFLVLCAWLFALIERFWKFRGKLYLVICNRISAVLFWICLQFSRGGSF